MGVSGVWRGQSPTAGPCSYSPGHVLHPQSANRSSRSPDSSPPCASGSASAKRHHRPIVGGSSSSLLRAGAPERPTRHNILGDCDIPWATPCRMKSQMTRRQPCLMRQWRSRFLQSPAWEECRRARRRRPRRSAISPKGAAPGTSTGAQVKPRGLVPAQHRPGTPHTGLRQGTTRHHRARAIDGVGKLATLSPA